MRKLVVITASALILATSAFAAPAPVGSDVPEVNKPTTPSVLPSPAPADTTLKTVETPASPDCKAVKVFRPDTDVKHPNIVLRFKDSAKAASAADIEKCDQSAGGSTATKITKWSTGGFQVKLTTRDGWGMVNLPIGLTDAAVDQVVCNFSGDMNTPAKYATQWSSSLPGEIKLLKLDSFDTASAKAGCAAALERLTDAERQSLGLPPKK